MNTLSSFKSLLDSTDEYFIGFGNPESNILFLGKECAGTKNDPWMFTTKKNAEMWKAFLIGNKVIERCIYPEKDKCNRELFSPRFAFKGQLNFWDKGRSIGGTSLTWLRYQRLIDPSLPKSQELNFQDKCFLTELSDIPKIKSDYSKETKESILRRVDSFLSRDFFKGFSIVVAACMSYVDRYQLDLQSLFPNSVIIVCHQLSRGITNEYIDQIASLMKTKDPGLYRIRGYNPFKNGPISK